MPARGHRGPYRKRPKDFEDLWPTLGWSAAEAAFGAHARSIALWVNECGRDRMILARKKWLDRHRAENRPQRRSAQ
jgi:hypothetical protein